MIGSDFIRQNPCRYCALGYTDKNGRRYPSFRNECYQCENNKKHKEYLVSQRKFQQGDPITTMDDLLKQQWVIWHGQTKHIEFIKSFQLRFVAQMLKDKEIFKAVLRDKKEMTLYCAEGYSNKETLLEHLSNKYGYKITLQGSK